MGSTPERTKAHPNALPPPRSALRPRSNRRLRFFFPDSQDQVDPSFDFHTEQSLEFKVRQRDDRYAHEILRRPAYDGLLVSKPIVDGLARSGGKYTVAQRHRLYRLGVHRFFRLDQPGWSISTMGDCGAFTYIREETPPYTVD